MINNYSKTLKQEVSFDFSTVSERQAAIGNLTAKIKGTTFDNKVRLFALAPLAVAEWDEISADSNVKRTQGEHAELMGLNAPMFSMMRQIVTILSYGSGADREGGWGDVVVGSERTPVDVAWQRLATYRDDHRDVKDVVMPLGAAAGAVLSPDGVQRFDGLVELFESFPGGMSGLYNLARGRTADGKVVKDDEPEQDDEQGDEPEQDDEPTSGLDMIAHAIGVARSQGYSDADIAKHVMAVLKA